MDKYDQTIEEVKTIVETNNHNEELPPFKQSGKNYYKTSDFPQLKLLDANYNSIKAELLHLIEEDKVDKIFYPWIETDLYEESNPDGWYIAPFLIGGKIIKKNCKKAPFLSGLIEQIPQLVSASFSLLKPGTHIAPHKGYDEYSEEVLRYHMGMIIPKGDLGIRVNEEIKLWKEGESFIFDDFLIHEAWNFSTEYRYVLICDFTQLPKSRTEANDDKTIEKLETVKEDKIFKDEKFNASISNYF